MSDDTFDESILGSMRLPKKLTPEEEAMERMIHNPIRFTSAVESIRKRFKISYIDAIIHYCDEKQIELEIVDELITPTLKEKIAAEAVELNFLPKSGILPV